jgi:Tfp pilus assembly protein PilX
MNTVKTKAMRGQRGTTMLMVMILMTVMLFGGLALARMTEAGYLITGNVASKDASVHAAEVGWNTAFNAVRALTNETADTGGWYFATTQAVDANGIPAINWAGTPTVAGGVDRYTVNYAVDRLCTVGTVTVAIRQCLVKLDPNTDAEDMSADAPDYMPKNSRQFRITVRVTDQRGTQTWTQALVTKGG